MTVSSIRKLADALDVSHTRLNLLVKQGRITAESDGSYDVEGCRTQFAQATGVEYRGRSVIAPPSVEATKGSGPVEARRVTGGSGGSFEDFNKARAEHERLKVREKELDLAEREKELLPADEVREKVAAMIGATRSRLLLMPDRVAPKVATLDDVLECRAVLEREVRLALMDLVDYDPVPALVQ